MSKLHDERLWVRAQTVFSALTFVTVAGLFVWAAVARSTDAQLQSARFNEVKSGVAAVEKELVQQRTSVWVSAKEVLYNCLASNDQATCTVTNMREDPITTCVRGVLTKREASGASLSSLPMCTGRLAPRETRTVSVPWSGGFARDLCSKKTYYGETLDWEQCRFNTEPVEPTIGATTASQEP
ncbi:MAG: hypothetical protein KF819_06050 [Labilithrix sp.]|nr:hypothetical protein [Labilithrix sp.]